MGHRSVVQWSRSMGEPPPKVTNEQIADILEQVAERLGPDRVGPKAVNPYILAPM